jgi:predicted DNA-binding protein with PD1-like motif
MKYSQGKIGRVFVVTLTEGEKVCPCLEELVRKEQVDSAVVLCVGGIPQGKVVPGPKDPRGRLEPIYQEFNDAREVFGIGRDKEAFYSSLLFPGACPDQ